MPDPDYLRKPKPGPLDPGGSWSTPQEEMWFWSEEWGEMRHRNQVAKAGTYLNPVTGETFQGAPLGTPWANNYKRNTGVALFRYVQPGPVDEPYHVITTWSDGRPDEIHWASGRVAKMTGDFDVSRPGRTAELLPHWAPGDDMDNPEWGTPRQRDFRVDAQREGSAKPLPVPEVLTAMRHHPAFRHLRVGGRTSDPGQTGRI